MPDCFRHLSYAVPLAGTYCPECASAARLFALCMLLVLIFGITVLSFDGKFRGITAAALVMSVLNIGYECFIPIRNTPDILDAVFGVIGVAIAYVFLILLRKNGLIAK